MVLIWFSLNNRKVQRMIYFHILPLRNPQDSGWIRLFRYFQFVVFPIYRSSLFGENSILDLLHPIWCIQKTFQESSEWMNIIMFPIWLLNFTTLFTLMSKLKIDKRNLLPSILQISFSIGWHLPPSPFDVQLNKRLVFARLHQVQFRLGLKHLFNDYELHFICHSKRKMLNRIQHRMVWIFSKGAQCGVLTIFFKKSKYINKQNSAVLINWK